MVNQLTRLIVVQEKVCVVGCPLDDLVVYMSHGPSTTENQGKVGTVGWDGLG